MAPKSRPVVARFTRALFFLVVQGHIFKRNTAKYRMLSMATMVVQQMKTNI